MTEPFEKKLAQLEKIIAQLEQDQVPLDQALTLFEQGISLTRLCQKTLDEAEKKLANLNKDE